jgi:hypothetical protein
MLAIILYDIEYYKALEKTLDEWLSEEDEEAYYDLTLAKEFFDVVEPAFGFRAMSSAIFR